MTTDHETATLPAPDTSLGLTWRPIEEADLAAWYELERAIEEADRLSEHYCAEDLREELLDGSWKEPARDSLLGLDAQGRAAPSAS